MPLGNHWVRQEPLTIKHSSFQQAFKSFTMAFSILRFFCEYYSSALIVKEATWTCTDYKVYQLAFQEKPWTNEAPTSLWIIAYKSEY